MQTKNKTWRGSAVLGLALGVSLAVASFASLSRPAVADDKAGNGMDCKHDFDCRSNDCFHDHCRGKSGEKNDDGSSCSHDFDCKSGDCFHNNCRGKSNAKADNGASCSHDFDCKSSDCFHDHCRGK